MARKSVLPSSSSRPVSLTMLAMLSRRLTAESGVWSIRLSRRLPSEEGGARGRPRGVPRSMSGCSSTLLGVSSYTALGLGSLLPESEAHKSQCDALQRIACHITTSTPFGWSGAGSSKNLYPVLRRPGSESPLSSRWPSISQLAYQDAALTRISACSSFCTVVGTGEAPGGVHWSGAMQGRLCQGMKTLSTNPQAPAGRVPASPAV